MKGYYKNIILKFLSLGLITLALLSFVTLIYHINYSKLLSLGNNIEVVVDQSKFIGVPSATGVALYNYGLSNIYFVIGVLLIPIIIIFIIKSKIHCLINEKLEKKIKNRYIQISANMMILYTLYFLLLCPFYFFRGFYRGKIIGIYNGSLMYWCISLIKAHMVELILIFLFGWIPILLLERFKEKWWIAIGGLSLPIIIVSTLLYPVFIDPLFYKPYKLKNVGLEREISNLAIKAKIKDLKIYEINKSNETKAMNAYMTGILNTKQIVFYDNTINNLAKEEILAVAAHEVGHYVLNHIPKGIIFGWGYFVLLLFLVQYTLRPYMNKGKLGYINLIKSNSELLNFILIVLLTFKIYSIIFQFLPNTYSRYVEKQADIFALELTKDNYSNGMLEIKFLKDNIAMPRVNRVLEFIRYTHPTPEYRINVANNYRPWEKDLPLKFESYFTKE